MKPAGSEEQRLPTDFFQDVRKTVAEHLPGISYRLYLFGSRVQGRASGRSDIDIGILAEHSLPLSTMARIREALEDIPVLQRIDLVDLSAASPDFAMKALSTAKLLDERHP